MHAANAIVSTHGGIRGTQARQAGQRRLDLGGCMREVPAFEAAWRWRMAHWPNRFQNSLNTWVDSTKPKTTLTATPAANA